MSRELQAVRDVVGRFVDRLDEVTERATDAIWEAVPSYFRAGEPLMEDVREAVRGNLAILAEVLSEGRDVTAEDLQPIERVGARRAEAGIPLDDVLQAYRMVSRVCWEVLSEDLRSYRGDAVEATIRLARSVLAYTDQISSSVAHAYAKAQRSIVREQEGARREFLADLLYGTEASPEDILRRAHTFGYDLSPGYIALVGAGPEDDPRKEVSLLSAASTVLADSTAEPIVLQKGEVTIALVPSDPSSEPGSVPEKIVAELGGGWAFGAGGPEPGLEGIRRAYLEAREALEIGLALGLDGPVFRFSDVLPYHFLRTEPALVDRFVEQTLGPLVGYDARRKGELVKTLEAYFDADGSVKLAAERLFAHPHTVSYRLKQIQKLTDWSLREPEHKLRLQLALRAHRLAQARRDIER